SKACAPPLSASCKTWSWTRLVPTGKMTSYGNHDPTTGTQDSATGHCPADSAADGVGGVGYPGAAQPPLPVQNPDDCAGSSRHGNRPCCSDLLCSSPHHGRPQTPGTNTTSGSIRHLSIQSQPHVPGPVSDTAGLGMSSGQRCRPG